MGKLITCLFILLQCTCLSKVFAQQEYQIIGTVPKGYEGSDITIKSGDNPSFIQKQTKAKNGRFILSGYTTQQYERVSISVDRNLESSKGASFFITPGKMEVRFLSFADERTDDKIQYINIPFIEDEKKYFEYTKPSRDSSSKASSLWSQTRSYNPKGVSLDSLLLVQRILRQRNLARVTEFIKANPQHYLSMYYFKQELLHPAVSTLIEPDSLLTIYNVFTKDLQTSSIGKSSFEAVKKRQSLLMKKEMPVFSFKTNTGEKYNLSGFRDNKYVLIVFWASWCGPCIKSIPVLKEIAKQYGNKGLEVISVSADRDSTSWLKAVEKYRMPWLQTCDLPSFINKDRVTDLYNIQLVPQYFLLDKKGFLIYQDLQLKDSDDHAALKKLLSELLDSPAAGMMSKSGSF